MTKPKQDIGGAADPFVSGDDRTLSITVKDEDGAAFDLTGVSAIKWQAFAYDDTVISGSNSISKTLGGGITVTSAAGGIFEITLDPADTSSLDGKFHHECQVTDSAGNVITVFTGTFFITKDYVT